MSLSFMDTLCSLLGGLETLYVLLWIKPSSWVPFIFDSQATSAVVSMFALALGCPHTSVCQVWCTSVSNGGSKDSRRSIRFILRLFKGWIAPLPHESNPYLQREYLTVNISRCLQLHSAAHTLQFVKFDARVSQMVALKILVCQLGFSKNC